MQNADEEAKSFLSAITAIEPDLIFDQSDENDEANRIRESMKERIDSL